MFLSVMPILASLACATGEVNTPPGDGGSCPGGCPAGQRCLAGRCVPNATCGADPCPAGEQCCAGACVNTRTDTANCGECDNDCAPRGNGCFAGVCACNGAAACAAGRACCGATLGCVDIMADPANCGGCGNACPGGEECLGGDCGGNCATGCPAVPHGTTRCAGERCAIATCDPGWADVDGLVGNGCECEITGGTETSGDSCDSAADLGRLPDTGGRAETSGTIVPATDEDWYRFTAVDTPDTSCDEFYVDIRFTENPGDQHEFEVFVPDCGARLCAGDTSFSYAIDLRNTAGPEIIGHCPCTATNTEGINMCNDDTKTFFVKVRRRTGGDTPATCAGYVLQVSNGVYSTASP